MSQPKMNAKMLSYYIHRQFCVFSEDPSRQNEQSADFADAADFLLYFVLVRVIVIDSRTKTQRHKGEEAHAETLRRGEERER